MNIQISQQILTNFQMFKKKITMLEPDMDSSYLLERLDCLQIYSENQGSKYIGLMALAYHLPRFCRS